MTMRPAILEEWQKITLEDPGATFFHTPDWYKIWEKYTSCRLETRLFEFDEGKKAVLPMVSESRLKGWQRFFISSPAGTYGGILANARLTPAEIAFIANYLRRLPGFLLVDNPFAVNSLPNLKQQKRIDFTQVVNLKEIPPEFWSQWSPAHQRSLKKAKDRIQVSTANGPQHWAAYFDLYQQSLARWGGKVSSNYRWDIFLEFQNLSDLQCRLWLAWDEEHLAAGCLCFYHGHHVVYWHGAANEACFPLRPNHALHAEIIRHARDSGFSWYDFNPSGGHEGVVRFKKGFGSRLCEVPVFYRESTATRLAGSLRTLIYPKL